MMETHARSIAKALTWRLCATSITFSVALLLLGDVSQAASIGIIDTIVKLAVFYFHERMWIRLSFGKLKPPDYQI